MSERCARVTAVASSGPSGVHAVSPTDRSAGVNFGVLLTGSGCRFLNLWISIGRGLRLKVIR